MEDFNSLANRGKELWKLVLSDLLIVNGPVMLPPAPNQKYVDKYGDNDLTNDNRKKEYNQNRKDYDAECLVYRALENLNQEIIVLHSLSYLTNQCTDIVNDGEHDFVVLVPGRAVINIEVKNPDPAKSFDRSWKSAGKQLKRFKSLVTGIGEPLPCLKILGFRAFPHVDQESASDKAKVDSTYLGKHHFENFSEWWEKNVASQTEKSDIGLRTYTFSMQENVLMGLWYLNCQLNHAKLKTKTNCQGRRSSSSNIIADTIYRIDNMLTSQTIYFKNQKMSDNLVKLSADYEYIFNSTLFRYIKYITKDQEKLLSAGPHVFVNGPAGSGKTLIMYARILKLLSDINRGQDEQIFVLVPWKGAATELKKLVEEFHNSVTIKMIDLVTEIRKQKCDPDLFTDTLEKSTEKLIIFIKPNFLLNSNIAKTYNLDKLRLVHESFIGTLQDRRKHIFCDDFHNSVAHYIISCKKNSGKCMDPFSENESTNLPLAHSLIKLLNNPCESQRMVWIGCDVMQIVQYAFWGTKELHKEVPKYIIEIVDNIQATDVVTLSGNLRNSYSISLLLKELRGKFLEVIGNCDKDLQQILPNQEFQHFIRGFTPCLYRVCGKGSFQRAAEVIRKELMIICKSLRVCVLPASIEKKIAVIPVYHHGCYISDAKTLGDGLAAFLEFREKVKSCIPEDFNVVGDNIFSDNVKYANSMEFPFAILILDMSYTEPEMSHYDNQALLNLLAHLYLGVSRARVWCSIVLICSNDTPSRLYFQVCEVLHQHVKTVKVD